MPGKTMIKVSSVIFIISSVIGIIFYLLATLLFGWATIDVGDKAGWIVTAIALLFTAVSVLQLIAGVKGVKGCDSKEAAPSLKVWGIIVLVTTVLVEIYSMIMTVFTGGESPLWAVVGLLVGLIFPLLYIIGANKNANA